MSPSAARGSRPVTFTVLAVAAMAFVLLQSLVVPVLSHTQREYGTDQTTVTWVLTAYLLSASVCTPLAGRLGDAYGKRRMLVASLGMLALGSLLAALAPTIGWLIAARVVQGAGGGVLPLAFGIIRDEFGARMPSAIAAISSMTAGGFGIGIVVAGPIVEHLGYDWLFLLPMVVTGLAALAALVFVPDSPERAPARLPVLPALLLSAWLITLLLALSKGNAWGWGSPRVLGLLALTVVLVLAWVRTEQRAVVPVIDLQLMRRRGVWTANLVALFVGFSTFASFGFLPQLLQTPPAAGYGLGLSITDAGHLLVPSAASNFAIGFVTAPLVRGLGARRVICTGSLMMSAGHLGVALFHDHAWQILCATPLQGIGSGLVAASLAGVVVQAVPRHQTGTASGMNANLRTIGAALGSAVMVGIVTARVGAAGHPAEAGYTVGFATLSAAMVLAAGAALLIPRGDSPGSGTRIGTPEALPAAGA